MAIISGTATADVLSGTPDADTINGFTGNDNLTGGGDDDLLFGGEGSDALDGGDGNDRLEDDGMGAVLEGGAGDDTISLKTLAPGALAAVEGGAGVDLLEADFGAFTTGIQRMAGENDFRVAGSAAVILGWGMESFAITGGSGNDTFHGGALADSLDGRGGNDLLVGLAGQDILDGGDGNDSLDGGDDGDDLRGGAGDDSLVGGAGNDTGDAGAGNDTLVGGDASDFLKAGEGDDLLVIQGFQLNTNTFFDGGAGNDLARIAMDNDAIAAARTRGVSNQSGQFSDGAGGTIMLAGVERLDLTGSRLDDTFTGGTSNDTIRGGTGSDVLDGGAGNDLLDAGLATGTFSTEFYSQSDSLTGSTGNDTLKAVVGNPRNAFFSPDPAFLTMDGGEGIDLLDLEFRSILQTSFPDGAAARQPLQIGVVFDGPARSARTASSTALVTTLLGFTNLEKFKISGTVFPDSLTGAAGNDVLLGGFGDDSLAGGDGDDRLSGQPGADTVSGGAGNDTIEGAGPAAGSAFLGATFGNVLDGGAGDDLLIAAREADGGRPVNDRVTGGAGNDTMALVIDRAFSSGPRLGPTRPPPDDYAVSFDGGADNDLARLSMQNPSATPEALVLDGEGSIAHLFGIQPVTNMNVLSRIAHFISVESYDVSGGSRDDSLSGAAGGDSLNGLGGNDVLSGNGGNDSLTGGTGNDSLTGGTGNDNLDGGTGIDSLAGGSGNDTYIVDAAGDVTRELAGEGTDTVFSPVSHTLAAEVENLVLTGVSAIAGTGNAADNRVTGNGAANSLSGAGGNDIIDGGPGNDSMAGGIGNDTYLVDSPIDLVTEVTGAGADTVRSTISYALGDNQENLILEGISSIGGTGNTLNNTIKGNNAANLLGGKDGNDLLSGGGGNDILDGASNFRATGGRGSIDSLTGGSGNDLFVLGTSSGILYNDGDSLSAGRSDYALITDFTAGQDRLRFKGTSGQYRFGASGLIGVSGTGVYFGTGTIDELIAVVRPASGSTIPLSGAIPSTMADFVA